jgi:hypothetical protein
MKKTDFFKKHGSELFKVATDSSEYGDFLILHPEEIPLAKYLEERGYTIVSVYETEDGEDFVDMSECCDYGIQPFKYGYFAINNSNQELL